MKSVKLFTLILLLVLVPMFLYGCGEEAAAPPSTNGGADVDVSDQEYVYLTVVSAVPYWVDTRAGLEDAGKALGVKVTFMGPPDFDVTAQARMLDDLIARRPAGIIIYPGDESLTEGINRAVEAGIPVITDNADAPESKRLVYMGFDGYNAGRTGAAIMAEALGGKGKVIIGSFPNPHVQNRVRGYKDYFEENYPEIEVVAHVNDHADPVRAPEVYTAAIAANPDVDGIIGTNGDSGRGIGVALTELGMSGQIKVVAMDRNDDMLPYIADGTILASLADKAYMNTFSAVHMLYWYHNESINPINNWKELGISILPERIETGIMVITKDNVEQFFH